MKRVEHMSILSCMVTIVAFGTGTVELTKHLPCIIYIPEFLSASNLSTLISPKVFISP